MNKINYYRIALITTTRRRDQLAGYCAVRMGKKGTGAQVYTCTWSGNRGSDAASDMCYEWIHAQNGEWVRCFDHHDPPAESEDDLAIRWEY